VAQSLDVSCRLLNGRMHFRGQADGQPPLDIDYIPPLGDNLGYMPLQLLLLSLAACIGGTVAPLLRRMKKEVAGLEVQAHGLRRERHPTAFETIRVELALRSSDVQPEDLERVIALAEESICPVWAMLKNNVAVTVNYTIAR
jgi:putative redox protein